MLEDRANYLARVASLILAFVLCLAAAAVVVFFFAASITRSDLTASDIDSKLNANMNTRTKLTKEKSAALQDIDARSEAVAGKLQAVGERLADSSSSKAVFLREDVPLTRGIDLTNDPTALGDPGQILLANFGKPNPDGSVSFHLMFGQHFAGSFRGSPEGWRAFVSNMKDFAPLGQALDAYQGAMKKERDLEQDMDLNSLAYRKLYDRKSSAIAGLLSATEDNEHSSTIVSLVATNVTRFGTLAIITFLISLSMSLYRYNIRLYAFYMARADALRMKGELGRVSLIALASSLTPGVDFGKTPQTPTEQVVELVRLAASIKGVKGESEE
jgi:hypothetical protein